MNASLRSASTRIESPLDVRVMNLTTAAVVAVIGGVLVLALAAWFARQPYFVFRAIRLEGEVSRNSVATVRANVASRLAGNFFTLNLQEARNAFEAVPWVRQAVVSRVWPNRLVVRLEEHKPVAIWRGDEGNDRLVNSHGEVFEANVGDVDDERLPEFVGDESEAPALLSMYQRLEATLRPLDQYPVRLVLSSRGSWLVELDDASQIDLGRGTEDELIARCERFVRTISAVGVRRQRHWRHADLRHADGYALRFKPVDAGPGAQNNH